MTLKEKERRWRQLRKEKLKAKQEWFVYYLPKEDYYGHTYDIKARLRTHRASGKNTDNFNIVKGPVDKQKALYFEKLYQGKIAKYLQKFKEKKNKECYIYFEGKLIAKTKNYNQAAKYIGLSKERVRKLINTNKPTKKGYTFVIPNYSKWTYKQNRNV